MQVTSDIRRREITDALKDAAPCAFVPAAANFMNILSELRSQDSGSVTHATEADTSSEPTETPASENNQETVVAVDSQDPAPDPLTKDEPAAEDAVELDAEMPDLTGTADAAPDEVVEAPEFRPSEALPVTDEVNVPDGDPLPPTVVAAAPGTQQDRPSLVAAVEGGSIEEIAVSPHVVKSLVETSTSTKPDENMLAVEADSAATEEAPSPAHAFPKTLNALLAQGALREQQGDGAAADVHTTVETAETVLKSPAADPPTEVRDTPPLPRATALEPAGVRPESAAVPRIPMANLPGELAQQIHLMQQEGVRTMRLRLVPENLGELHIEIKGAGDTMRVRLVSSNPAVRDALESQMPDLKEALQRQGLSLDKATVDSGSPRRDAPQEHSRSPAPPVYRGPANDVVVPTRTTAAAATSTPALTANALNLLA